MSLETIFNACASARFLRALFNCRMRKRPVKRELLPLELLVSADARRDRQGVTVQTHADFRESLASPSVDLFDDLVEELRSMSYEEKGAE